MFSLLLLSEWWVGNSISSQYVRHDVHPVVRKLSASVVFSVWGRAVMSSTPVVSPCLLYPLACALTCWRFVCSSGAQFSVVLVPAVVEWWVYNPQVQLSFYVYACLTFYDLQQWMVFISKGYETSARCIVIAL